MLKLNVLFTLILLICALGVVTAQHKARKRFVMLEEEKGHAAELALELGRLELEQSSLITHARIDEIARGKLEMSEPSASRIRMISPDRINLPSQGIVKP